MPEKIFIGVAWPYVNGDLHIGHLAGYLMPADITARYHRLQGRDVLMVSGSDCHGTPITVEADKRGITPQEVVDEYHVKDVHLFKDVLHLSFDLYTRTDTDHHAKVTQDIFIKLLEEGYVFVDSTQQYYSEKESRFLPDRYVIGTCPHCEASDARSDQCDNCGKLLDHDLINPRSNLSGDSVQLKDTQHYFLDWAKLQLKLEKYVDRVGESWRKWVYKETLGWLKEGLKPRAITRDIDWGVSLPVDRIPDDKLVENIDQKRLYVWFDAVIGYLSASILWEKENGGDWKSFWYDGENDGDVRHYYFMGKDNLVFHTLFWPGKLMIYDKDLHLPDNVCINMFLNFGGQQFSKSRGVSIGIKEMVEEFGNDSVRFYLTLIMPETRDTSFTWEDFTEKVNSVLVGNLGNFIHRVLSIGKGEGEMRIQESESRIQNEEKNEEERLQKTEEAVVRAFQRSRKHLENCEFRAYLDDVLELSAFGNRLFDQEKVWELKKQDTQAYQRIMHELLLIILALGHLMQPLLFEASENLFQQLGLDVPEKWPQEHKERIDLLVLLEEVELPKTPKPLFEKIEEATLS